MSRSTQVIWNDVSTGSDGFSEVAEIGVHTDVTVYLEVGGATIIKVLCAAW